MPPTDECRGQVPALHFSRRALSRFEAEAAGVSRRAALRAAAAMGVSFVLPGLDVRAAERRGAERPKSLITLWLAGGPSQLETWDPHPQSRHGGPTKAIETTLPGCRIAHLYPQVAEQLGHLNVIRSLVSKEGDHARGTYFVQTGYRPDPTVTHPSLGAIVARTLQDDSIEIPTHVALATGDNFTAPMGGYLGAEYDAFRVHDPGQNLQNLQSRTRGARQKRRLEGLSVLSRSFERGRMLRAEQTQHQRVVDRALKMMTSEQLVAFRLDDEPRETLERYGDSRFGRGCLVARRLVEQGVRAIQVTLGGFDTHTDNFTGHEAQAQVLDPAFAALIQELRERDLLQSTVILCIGEFGRTPGINPLDGRDHWPNGFSCVVGGGGLASGQLIGATDPDRQVRDKKVLPADPVALPDLYATVMQVLGIDWTEEILTPIGRPIALSEGSPLSRLLG